MQRARSVRAHTHAHAHMYACTINAHTPRTPRSNGIHRCTFRMAQRVALAFVRTEVNARILFARALRVDALWFGTRIGTQRTARAGRQLCSGHMDGRHVLLRVQRRHRVHRRRSRCMYPMHGAVDPESRKYGMYDRPGVCAPCRRAR